MGYSLAAIKKFESDERRPSRQIAERLADILGVPANQREIFLEVARGLRPVDYLSLAREPAVSSPPTGTVTFLYTDIEGSTKLAQEHPEKWETLRARHHAILLGAIESNNGYVFQVVGDGFCAAFHTPNDGFHAAIEAQRKLQTENWGEVPLNVRMGIHTGEAEAHGNEYYSYLTLSLVQRIMSAGHGGQILLSHATENLLRGHLPKDVSLLDLQTLDNQTYRKLSIQVGDGFTWCEQNGGDGNTPQNTVATISLDLTNLACSGADLTQLQYVNIYLQPGTFRIDNVRAE